MKMQTHKRRKAQLLVATFTAMALVLVSSESQSSVIETCIANEYSLKSVEGRVVFAARDERYRKDEAPISGAVVELKVYGEEGWETIAKVDADEKGYFRFPTIKPGRYSLSAEHEGFQSEGAYIRVKKSSGGKLSDKQIIIALQMTLGGCGYTRLEKIKQ